ncbi:phage major capsid protein [Pseudomonas oryzihabitans]|uniref:phage major capsid protein n=1 Tax=Pseudomonas oryzihabitans TaxID=47885 RepID=UPI003EBD3C35
MSKSAHAQRWDKLRAMVASGGQASATDPRVIETITNEMTEMDQDVGRLYAVQKEQLERQEQQDNRQNELQARVLEMEQRMVSGGGAAGQSKPGAKRENPVAASLIETGAFDTLRAGQRTSGQHTVTVDLRAALTNPGRGKTGDTEWNTEPDRLGVIQGIAPVRLTLLDVLPVQQVSGNTLEYVLLDGYVNGADYQVEEGDEKAETKLPTKVSRAEVATIAHWLPASKQVLDDNTGLSNQIGQILTISLRQKLEHEVLVGAGGEGKIKGLVALATQYAPTATLAADRIGQAITDLNAAGWNTSVVVLNPTDWFSIASTKNDTAEYTLGSPRDPSPASLWGVRVVTNQSMPAGQALLLDTSQTVLLDRQQVTVEASRQDGDNFRRNMVTILAELRAGLAVYATTATRIISLAAPATK